MIMNQPALSNPSREVSITWLRLPLVNFSANGLDAKVVFKEKKSTPNSEQYLAIRDTLIEKLQRADCNEENIIFCVEEIKKNLLKALVGQAPSKINLSSQPSFSQPYRFSLAFSLNPNNESISFSLDFYPILYTSEDWSDLHLSIQATLNNSTNQWTPSELYHDIRNIFNELWDTSQEVEGFSQEIINIVCTKYPFFHDVNFHVSGKKMLDHEEIEDISILCKCQNQLRQVS
jgi:hypothetical protein